MISTILMIVLGLAAFIGFGAIVMALAEVMAKGSETFDQPTARIYVQDWRDFAEQEPPIPSREAQPQDKSTSPFQFPARQRQRPGGPTARKDGSAGNRQVEYRSNRDANDDR